MLGPLFLNFNFIEILHCVDFMYLFYSPNSFSVFSGEKKSEESAIIQVFGVEPLNLLFFF